MAFDIDDDELRATREMASKNKFSEYTEKWMVEFVKNQEEFVKQECLNYLADNKIVRTFKIDRDTLEYIFNLGFAEYKKRNEKSADELFDELDYEKQNNPELEIKYIKNQFHIIRFWKPEQKVIKQDEQGFYMGISMQELQVINKKCKEMRVDRIMFLKKEIVKIPIEPKILVHYCRDCESTEIETIQTCKKCGSHNIASPFCHTFDDYKNGVGTKQKTKEVTKYFYKCDLCGKQFDGFNIDNYLSYGNGSFEVCNYNNFSDAEDVDFINYQLQKDLCSECKSKIRTHLELKLIEFTREKNVNKIIDEYFKNKENNNETTN